METRIVDHSRDKSPKKTYIFSELQTTPHRAKFSRTEDPSKEIAEIFPLNFQLKIVVVLEQSRWKTWIFESRQDANVAKTMAFSNPHLHLDSKRKL